MAFQVISSAFEDGGAIPAVYSCDGQDRSPALSWHDVPAGTQSFVLIVDDPDAPGGRFTHWVLFDIPADVRSLTENESATGIQGINDFQTAGYNGPCPPPGGSEHRYLFTLYALDIPSIELSQRATRREVESALQGHVLGQAQISGRYGPR